MKKHSPVLGLACFFPGATMDNKVNILVVEDDADLRNLLQMQLEFKGYSVSKPDHILRIEEWFGEQPVDLILMDMLLSAVKGTDLCRNLKDKKETAGIPVIMLSAHPTARETCLAAGADAFIAKPFDMKELFAIVENLLKKRPATPTLSS